MGELLVRVVRAPDDQDIDRSPIRAFLEERSRDAKDAVRKMRAAGHAAVSKRLDELIDLAELDWPDVEVPSSQAIKTVTDLLNQLGNTTVPSVTLSRQGQIWVQWGDQAGRVALIVGAEAIPAIAGLLPDKGSLGRRAHFNFYGSVEQVADRMIRDPDLCSLLQS
jgi:hypothetical protein